MSRLIGNDDASQFERGLLALGEILGFESVRPNETSDPDGAWRDGDTAWVLWEAKTMEKAEGTLAVRDVRQANSHATWVERKLGWSPAERTVTSVVCERVEVHEDVPAVAEESLMLVEPGVIRGLAVRTVEAIRAAAAELPGLNPDQLRSRLGELLQERRLGTEEILGELTTHPLAST